MTTSSARLCSPTSPAFWKALSALPLLVLLAALQTPSGAQPSSAQNASLDPPGQVARLNLAEGAVSFAPANAAGGSNGNAWTPARLNRPLTRGDRLWTGPRARSELHVGSTAVRMSGQTSLDFLELDDDITELRLAQGSVQLRVRALYEGQRLEINTPNLAFVITQPGNYRVDVNPASDTTRVVAQSGSGTIYGNSGASLTLGSQQQGTFTGTQLAAAAPGAAVADSFDLWAAARDQREDQSVSARYIPRETIGYQQLDSYGDWQQNPTYGAVWLPRAVPVNWAPYRAGHWDWISPWGWTWVDDAPWGFAPFHYGRWAQIGQRWAWVPGRLPARPVYAPALVAFVGGGNGGGVNWNISIGSGGAPRPALGWFPLAPGEAFRPAYRASPRYVTNINNNIVVNNTVNVTNIYRYQRQPAAVTVVSREDFARGRPVRGDLQALSATDLNRAQVVRERSALPQRLERPDDRRERPRLAPAALPPAAVAAQAVVRSQGEHGNDRRDFKNRPDERRNDPRPQRPENSEHTPRALLPVPARPVAPVLPGAPTAAAIAVQPPAMRLPVLQAPERKAAEAEQKDRREKQTLQREQELATQQGQQRRQGGEEALRQLRVQREQREQAQQAQQQGQRDQQRQQAELARQQDQQRRQGEAAQGQQRAAQEQAQQQAQAQQQRALQQDQQRKKLEPPALQQPDQRAQPGAEKQPPRPDETRKPRGPRSEGEAQRNREQRD